MIYELADSAHVDAPPTTVYELVSDVTRTGLWSTQCWKCVWDGPDRGVGATFTGHNRTAEREWQTVSTVVIDEPEEAFVWSVGPGKVVWGFRLAPEGNGTRLTHFTEFGATAQAVFLERFGADQVENEIAARREAARAGIPATLAAVSSLLDGSSARQA